jgi:molybdopterin-guanine dinucleotide biosynthesis protein MobB
MPTVAGYILTGGKNRRMNGQKKLFLEYNGSSFFKHIISALDMFDKVYLSVDKTEPFEKLNMPMVVDIFSEIGPMGGVYSGLKECEEDALFVVACDMPLIDRESVKIIYEEYMSHPDKITIARSVERIHPLFGIYPKSALPVMEKLINEHEYRMSDLLSQAGHVEVMMYHNEMAMENINTPEEYHKLEKKPFFYAISGYKNTGKTTMITRLIPELTKLGLKVAVIKHDGHDFESDVPETDSWRHQKAGAYGTAVFSNNRVLITKECTGIDEVQIARAFPEADVILIEGLKNSDYPKYICNYPEEELADARQLALMIKDRINDLYK